MDERMPPGLDELEASEHGAMDAAVGQRIRALRTARSLSLKTVSSQSGFSIAMLSLIERGLSSASIRVLTKLATVLGATVADFIPGGDQGVTDPDTPVLRLAQRPLIDIWRAGITKQVLTPTRHGNHGLVLYEVSIAPRGSTGGENYTHEGEEAGVVLEGVLQLCIQDESYLLNAGDGFRFLSATGHRFSNPSDSVTRVLWVNFRDQVL